MRIVEVGPRDGLQNESIPIPVDLKLSFIKALAEAGLREIEATSFVHPKAVPQLADADELWPQLPSGPSFSALVPNLRGQDRALKLGVERISLFTAASDEFTQKNIGMTVEESLDVFRELIPIHREAHPNGWIRGYVSTIFECPYSGLISPLETADVCGQLIDLGVDEISLGDTIGVGTPREVKYLARLIPEDVEVAWHFHDTRGTAIANVAQALELGYRSFDASARWTWRVPLRTGRWRKSGDRRPCLLLGARRISHWRQS